MSKVSKKPSPEISKEDVYKKQYKLQGKVLKWRPLNFKLMAACEKMKIVYEQFEKRYVQEHMGQRPEIINEVMKLLKGLKPDKLQQLILEADSPAVKKELVRRTKGNSALTIQVVRETLAAQAIAMELFILEDGIIKNLADTCLDTSKANINYDTVKEGEIKELLEFGKELRDDFFTISGLKPGKL